MTMANSNRVPRTTLVVSSGDLSVHAEDFVPERVERALRDTLTREGARVVSVTHDVASGRSRDVYVVCVQVEHGTPS